MLTQQTDFSQGKLVHTGRTLDLALSGPGFFTIETPQGPLYTRNGLFHVDANGQPLDGSKANYTLTFPKGELPPARAFRSVTMYDGESGFLVKNPLDRYLINSPMLPDLKRNGDGSLTLHIQHESPEKERESNWLPAPDGGFYMIMRLYWPRPEALDGRWTPPPVVRVDKG